MTNVKGDYGKSAKGHFRVIDSIGVPHPYCIGPEHLQYNDSIYIGAEQIRRMEKQHPTKVHCMVKGCNLSYDEHEQGLIIECKVSMVDPNNNNNTRPELYNYLLQIKEEAEENGYVGFAFLDKTQE